MKTTTIILAFCLLLAGCGKTPVATDLKPFLVEAMAKQDANIEVGDPTVDVTKDADKFKVKFKAPISPKTDLYERVDSIEVLKAAGWNEQDLDSGRAVLEKLPSDIRDKLNANRPKNASDIVFLKKTSDKGSQGQWYGASDCAYYVDKWGCSNLTTDNQTAFPGKPKSNIGDGNGIVIETTEGKEIIANIVGERKKFIDQLTLSEEFDKKLQSENVKRVSAENTVSAMSRKMPIELQMRNAALHSKGKVLRFTNTSMADITLDVVVSSSSSGKAWRMTIPALKNRELGWAEGWPFNSGDELKVTSGNFDEVRLKIR